MANTKLATIGVGLEIDNKYSLVPLSDVPGSAGLLADEKNITDTAKVGSTAIVGNRRFRKMTVGTTELDWDLEPTLKDLIAEVVKIPRRDDARVADETAHADITAASTAIGASNGLVDGVQLANGDRVLPVNMVTNPNVLIVVDNAGSFSYTEDTRALGKLDRVAVEEGTRSGNDFAFDGTTWVSQTAIVNDEDSFQNVYAGKPTAGSATPQYVANTVITNGDDLTAAAGKLAVKTGQNESAITAAQNSVTGVQSELDNTQAGAGLNTNGSYAQNTGDPVIGGATDQADADNLLAAAVKTNQDLITNVQTGNSGNATAISANTDEIANNRTYIGKPTSGATLPVYPANSIIADSDNLTVAQGKVVVKLGALADRTNGENLIVDSSKTHAENIDSVANYLTSVARIKKVSAATTPVNLITVEAEGAAMMFELDLMCEQGSNLYSETVKIAYNGTATIDTGTTGILRLGEIPGMLFDFVVDTVAGTVAVNVSSDTSAVFRCVRRILFGAKLLPDGITLHLN